MTPAEELLHLHDLFARHTGPCDPDGTYRERRAHHALSAPSFLRPLTRAGLPGLVTHGVYAASRGLVVYQTADLHPVLGVSYRPRRHTYCFVPGGCARLAVLARAVEWAHTRRDPHASAGVDVARAHRELLAHPALAADLWATLDVLGGPTAGPHPELLDVASAHGWDPAGGR